ncbi:MAG: TonB-dependent receptor [Gammaproteobacteria bacterium]|nr:TonB-dependent receptor [Gammaproteobacteria bacterium]
MHGFKKYIIISLLSVPLSIYAQDGTLDSSAVDETQELEQLLELLQEQTTLATKSRLNADYVPGMITVLQGHELSNKGIRTVWEALSLVPGVDLSIEETGRKQVVIRGIGRTYASGNSKILLNGTSMNTANQAHADPVMNIPVEQVERIEVIRGPGSAVHGEFALAGVINVITRTDENAVFVTAGENGLLGAGMMLTYNDKTTPFSMNLNLAGWETDGPDIIAGEDELYYESGVVNSTYSNAPGPTNEAAEDKTAILSMNYHKFSLTAQWLKDGYGDHFGRNQILPPDEKRIVTSNEYRTLEARQLLTIDTNWSSEIYAGWQDKEQNKNDLFVGPSQFTSPAIDGYVDVFYREQRSNAGVDFKWTDNQMHQVLLGIEYVDINVDHELNEYKESGVVLFDWYFVEPDKRRRIRSTTFQEEFRPNDEFTVTFGLRHDNYNDIDSELSPRLASVWRIDQSNIFKAQYARAFRPPTFYEMAAAITEVEGSTINTFELGYIYKNNDSEYGVTLFNSKIDQFIVFVDQQGFRNTESANMLGIEFELTQQISKKLDIDANISYLDSEDNNTGQALAGSTDWIGNLGINYQPVSRTNLALQYHYTGESYREATDTRDRLDAYSTTDFTLSLTDFFGKNTGFRAGIKNLFDQDVKYPAPMLSYVDDHPRAGRQWWLQFEYGF